ncbi:MAG: DUF1569 domain-containing protein [Terriglobales bacterium]
MKTLFEQQTADEIISRINNLKPTSPRQWGKMNAPQMMAHCSAGLDLASGRLILPRLLLGRLFGPLARPLYSNEKPFSKNMPTDKKLVIPDQRDFQREQEQLKTRVLQFHQGGEAQCTTNPHPFFGKLTPQEWGTGMYKHLDHHLRQFGA